MFVSSTFADRQIDRFEMHAFIYPALKLLLVCFEPQMSLQLSVSVCVCVKESREQGSEKIPRTVTQLFYI